jgi:carbonic anhydrase
MQPQCEVIVVACIDFRFQHALDRWLAAQIKHGSYDRVGLAGGVKNWEVVWQQIELAKRLHNIRRVILINHEDCGAYGAEGTREKHESDLRAARQAILRQLPAVEVELYFARLTGALERVAGS